MGKQKRSENTYQKIQTVFKRDEKNVIMPYAELTQPEFDFLRQMPWRCEEKIDGTNIRLEVRHDSPERVEEVITAITTSGRTTSTTSARLGLERDYLEKKLLIVFGGQGRMQGKED